MTKHAKGRTKRPLCRLHTIADGSTVPAMTEAAPAERAAPVVDAASEWRSLIQAVAVFAALVGTAFENGGFFPGTWTTVTVAFLWLLALALLLDVPVELTRLDAVWLALIAAVVAWTALSIVWSLNERASVFEVRRGLVYLAAAGALLLLGTRRSPQQVAAAVCGAASVVIVYALARYLLAPTAGPDQFQVNLLFRPLGYANAVGIFAGVAAVLAVGLAARGSSPWLRAPAAASLAPLTAAICLTASRASALAVVVGLAVMLAVDVRRVDLAACLLVVAPVALVLVALCERADLTSGARAAGSGEGKARLLALSIALASCVLAFAPPVLDGAVRRIGGVDWRRLRPLAAVALMLVAAAAILGRSRADAFFTTGYRPTYWRVAWREVTAHPFLGGGAGTFADYWSRYGSATLQGGALDAHNLYLETLAELGVVGLLLVGSMLALPLAAALLVRAQPLVSAAAGAYAAFLAHAAVDWDWEMPAVTLAAVACAVVILLAQRERRPAHVLPAALRALALCLALALAAVVLSMQLVPGLKRPFP